MVGLTCVSKVELFPQKSECWKHTEVCSELRGDEKETLLMLKTCLLQKKITETLPATKEAQQIINIRIYAISKGVIILVVFIS